MSSNKENFTTYIPVLASANPMLQETFDSALKNLLEINTVECPSERYNKTGLLDEELGLMIRAGAQYASPWTRDASVNSWNCASIIEPAVAENTLWAVCERNEDGKLILQMDDQCWDKIIWAIAAWNHYLVTGNTEFLVRAYEVVATSLSVLEKTNYSTQFGLFTGGSFFNDGITGYPKDLHDPESSSSFVLDHQQTHSIMTLSTNCIYAQAYAVAQRMAELCGDSANVMEYADKCAAVKHAINLHLWNEVRGSYDYILYPDGRKCHAQEACGISFALLFGMCDADRAEALIKNLEISPCGLASILPPFPGLFSKDRPGRHNNLIWPFINGFFITALSQFKKAALLEREINSICRLVKNSENEFFEIYNPYNGENDGGWQVGRHWGACHHQTWSATAYIRAIIHGLFGLTLHETGISISPCVPEGWNGLSLKNIHIRGCLVDIVLSGSGTKVSSVRINGIEQEDAFIPFEERGNYKVEITLCSD